MAESIGVAVFGLALFMFGMGYVVGKISS